MLRMKARVSSSIFRASVSGRSAPPAPTAAAAPMLVPGAITAKLAAAATKVPAEAALAPAGDTYTATGTCASRSRSTISRVESTRPPGVSKRMTASETPSSRALSSPRAMWAEDSGSMAPSISMTSTVGSSARTE